MSEGVILKSSCMYVFASHTRYSRVKEAELVHGRVEPIAEVPYRWWRRPRQGRKSGKLKNNMPRERSEQVY